MKHSHPDLYPVILSLAVILATTTPAWTQNAPDASADEQKNDPLNAVVKLEVSKTYPNIYRPWVNITDGSTGSGVVIEDGLILTCAHCVADSSYIRVRKQNEDSLYHAHAEFIDNDADLALVRVEDAAFMADIDPMELGDTPHVQDDVLAVGYPIGGEDISFTRGIVSRIEDIRYSHGWTWLLGVQVDAAINPGNSGGPVLDMKTFKIANLRHLVELVEQCHDGFIRFGLDRDTEWDKKMIVDAKEMRETTARVMERYQIPADRSEDLRTPAAN